jgi:hypothetical protein
MRHKSGKRGEYIQGNTNIFGYRTALFHSTSRRKHLNFSPLIDRTESTLKAVMDVLPQWTILSDTELEIAAPKIDSSPPWSCGVRPSVGKNSRPDRTGRFTHHQTKTGSEKK